METHDFRRSVFGLLVCSSISLSESLDEKLLADPPLRIFWSVRATLCAWTSLVADITLPRRVEFGVSSPRVFNSPALSVVLIDDGCLLNWNLNSIPSRSIKIELDDRLNTYVPYATVIIDIVWYINCICWIWYTVILQGSQFCLTLFFYIMNKQLNFRSKCRE